MVSPRSGVNYRHHKTSPSRSSENFHRNGERTVSSKVQRIDKSAKVNFLGVEETINLESGTKASVKTCVTVEQQAVERAEDGFSKPVSPQLAIRSGVANGAQDGISIAISPNPHVKSGSSWPPWIVKEPRGNQVVMANSDKDGSSKPVSFKPHAEPCSSWSAWTVKDPRGDQGVMANRAKDRSSKPVLLNPHAESCSSWSAWTVKPPRGNQVVMANRAKNGSLKPVSLKPHANSCSSWSPWTGKDPRGNQEVMSNRAEVGSSKPISLNPHAEPYSSWPPWTVKEPIGNQEVMANRAEDGSSKPVSLNPHIESGSSWPTLTVKELRGNQKVMANRTEDGSSKSLSLNYHAGSRPIWPSWTVKEPSGNQVVTVHRAEDGPSKPVSVNPHEESSSHLPPCMVKGPRGKKGGSIPGPESVQGQKDVAISSKEVKSFDSQHNETTDPVIASLLPARLPPIGSSGENYSSLQGKLCNSQNLSLSGPALKPVWKGNFEVLDFSSNNKICEGFLAHPASKVSSKAYGFARQIAGVMQFRIHPRRAFWPALFHLGCPDANDIALYFYPKRSDRSKQQYADLLRFIDKQDLLLRSVLGCVELLVLPSRLLHEKCRELDGHYFMWGVFHHSEGKKVAHNAEALPSSLPTAA